VTQRLVMESPLDNRATPHDDVRAVLVAAHDAALRRSRRYVIENVGSVGAVDAATELPDATAEVDTEHMLADDREGVLGAVEVSSVPAAIPAACHVLIQEAASSRVASVKASDDEGREPGNNDHADKSLALNVVSTVEGGASAACGPAIGPSFRERGAAASDEAGTGTQRKAANGLTHGENMHGRNFTMKLLTTAGASVGASVAGKDPDEGYRSAKLLESAYRQGGYGRPVLLGHEDV